MRRMLLVGLCVGLTWVATGTFAIAQGVNEGKLVVATSRLVVLPSEPTMLYARVKPATLVPWNVQLRSVVMELTSQVVLHAALQSPKISPLKLNVEQLRKKISVKFEPDSLIVEVKVRAGTQAEAQLINNEVVDAFIRHVVENDHRHKLERLEKLRKIWEVQQTELKSKRAALRSLMVRAEDSSRGALSELLRQRIATDTLQRDRIEVEQAGLKARVEQLSAQKDLPPEVAHTLKQASADLAAVDAQMALLSKRIKDNSLKLVESQRAERSSGLDLSQEKTEMEVLERASRQVADELNRIEVELTAPERVRVIDRAN